MLIYIQPGTVMGKNGISGLQYTEMDLSSKYLPANSSVFCLMTSACMADCNYKLLDKLSVNDIIASGVAMYAGRPV